MEANLRRRPGWEQVLENIRNRRSVFPPAFGQEKVPKEEIEVILEAANWAPTHKMTQPWRFVVIRENSREALAKFLLAYYDKNTPQQQILEKKRAKILANPTRASAVIAIIMHRDERHSIPEWEELAATACAVQNLWLAAAALGIGGYWSSPKAMKDLASFLDLEPGEKCLGLFYLGYPDTIGIPPKRSPWQAKVRWMQ